MRIFGKPFAILFQFTETRPVLSRKRSRAPFVEMS